MTGAALMYSSYLGGANDDYGYGIAVDIDRARAGKRLTSPRSRRASDREKDRGIEAWGHDEEVEPSVSEALYLSSPDGNGVEIYAGRPCDQWPCNPDGSLHMSPKRLDLDNLLAELHNS